ncbi:MAG: nitroreductase [Deltaproteobacteria bacterium]|nr:nitroreductase [Deltaproteobacteria bacterium]
MPHPPDVAPEPYLDAMARRYSCRTCDKTPISAADRHALESAIGKRRVGPFGTQARFQLLAATPEDSGALKGLGTYGFVRNPAGFLLGATGRGPRSLEDFGYLMEGCILDATILGIGTCWLGGTFTRSRFAEKLALGDEEMPAVVAVGYPAAKRGWIDRLIRRGDSADRRMPWEKLFFDGDAAVALSRDAAGKLTQAIEMVRRAPSASNCQPWRIVKQGSFYDFHLLRTPGYRERNKTLFGIADMQRVDMGIAMCHLELGARELGLTGRWIERSEQDRTSFPGAEYTVSFEIADGLTNHVVVRA